MPDAPLPLPRHLSLVAPLCQTETEVPARLRLPDAGFAAHLIAMRVQAPAFRAKRRAAPGVAISAYHEAASLRVGSAQSASITLRRA